MRRFARRVAAASLLPVSTVSAQFGTIEKLFDSFTDVSLTASWGRFAPKPKNVQSHHGFFSYGAEFAFQIAEVTRPVCVADEDPRAEGCYAPEVRAAKRECRLAPTAKEIQVRVGKDGRDSTIVYEVEEECEPPKRITTWLVEFALGYSQSTGFISSDPAFEIGGIFRESPSILFFASYQPLWLAPYLGLRTGMIKLDELQLTGDTTFVASPSSAQFGLTVGVVTDYLKFGERRVSLGPFNVFVEASYTYRAFPRIKWSTPNRLPPNAPSRLSFSGWAVGTGISIQLKDPDKKGE